MRRLVVDAGGRLSSVGLGRIAEGRLLRGRRIGFHAALGLNAAPSVVKRSARRAAAQTRRVRLGRRWNALATTRPATIPPINYFQKYQSTQTTHAEARLCVATTYSNSSE